MKENYTIGDLVKELKINKETIRYYERIGLLDESKRDKNGYRLYSKEDVEKIKFILIVKRYGFSLKEISTLLSKVYDEIYGGDIESIKNIIKNKIIEINSKVDELDKIKKLLMKVNDKILSQNKECCGNLEDYL